MFIHAVRTEIELTEL